MKGMQFVIYGSMLFVVLGGAFALSSCGFFEEDEALLEEAFTIESASISDNAENVPVDLTLRFTFNKEVSPGQGNLLLKDEDGNLRQIFIYDSRVVIDGKVVSVSFAPFLEYGTTYEFQMGRNNFVDDQNNLVDESLSISFSTEVEVFSFSVPSEDVSVEELVLVSSHAFDLEDSRELLMQRLAVSDVQFQPVAISNLRLEGLKLVVEFETNLDVDAFYQVVLPAGVVSSLGSSVAVSNQALDGAFRTHDGDPTMTLTQTENVHPEGSLVLGFGFPVVRLSGVVELSEVGQPPVLVPEANIILSNLVEGSSRVGIELSGITGLQFSRTESKRYALRVGAGSFESVDYSVPNTEATFGFETANAPVLMTMEFPNALNPKGHLRLAFNKRTLALSNEIGVQVRSASALPTDPEQAPSPAVLASKAIGTAFLYTLDLSSLGDYVLDIGENAFGDLSNPDLSIPPVRIDFSTLNHLRIERTEPSGTLRTAAETNITAVKVYFSEGITFGTNGSISILRVNPSRAVRSLKTHNIVDGAHSGLTFETSENAVAISLNNNLPLEVGEYKVVFSEGVLQNIDRSGDLPRIEHMFLRVVENPVPVLSLSEENLVLDSTDPDVALEIDSSKPTLRVQGQSIELRRHHDLGLVGLLSSDRLRANAGALSLSLNGASLDVGTHYFVKILSGTIVNTETGDANNQTFLNFRTAGEGFPHPLFVLDEADTTSTAIVGYNDEDNKPILRLNVGRLVDIQFAQSITNTSDTTNLTLKFITSSAIAPRRRVFTTTFEPRNTYFSNDTYVKLYERYRRTHFDFEPLNQGRTLGVGLVVNPPTEENPNYEVILHIRDSHRGFVLASSRVYLLRMHSLFVRPNSDEPEEPFPPEESPFEIFFEIE